MPKQDFRLVQNSIAAEGQSWTAEANFFTSLPEEELLKRLGYVPGGDDISLEARERMSIQNYASFLSTSPFAEGVSAPAAIDWRNKNGQNFISPVKDQGSCGSCVAFGAVATVESKIKILRGAAYAVDLSEAHLFYCIARSQGRTCGGSTGGWWPEPSQVGFRDIGVCDETCYPYTAGDQNCTSRCADWQNRAVRTTGYTKINSIPALKDWIANNGPVQGCFLVYSDFPYYKSGVYRKTSNATLLGGHCVSIIGYDDGQQCWICKNSWGPAWGDHGFFRIGYGQCGIDAESFGVNGILSTRWIRNKRVIGLWANNEEKNAWAYLSDEGWQKISNNNDDGFINTLRQLSAAKAVNAAVDVHIEDHNMIDTVYVF